MKIRIIISIMMVVSALHAQNERVLSISEYLGIVREHHPMIYKSELVRDFADANELMSRGSFDPKLGVTWDQKAFQEKNYYSIFNGGVKIPTWYAVDLKAGYDWNSGVFLDDSENLPSNGLIYGGVSIPLGQGLLIDERRTEVRKAQVFVQSSIQEQRILLNELIYNALDRYIDWQEAFFNLQIAEEGVELARIRLQGSISSFRNGDIPAIDTLEAFISLQSRQIEQSEAEQNLIKTRLGLNNFLWIQGDIPLELEPFIQPTPINFNYLEAASDSLVLVQDEFLAQHPELLQYEYKIESLDIEERLNREFLKPDLRLDYNPLYQAGTDFQPIENYKLGISAAYPLLQRKARGKLRMTRVKLQDTYYDFSLKRQDLQVKLETYYNLQRQLEEQNVITADAVVNYRRLLEAENRKFEIGESSIFLINSREIKYLESRYKLIQGQSKLIKSRLIYLLLSGLINQVV
ncbi:TolC family protein [Portibacter marinus]|uniref:TolC family protein n=1 Tax=Portibacter marinus TaxID=2898660 RepID=UPI001F488B62|nr:TolC family protein [Portibacter marinus]